MTGQSSTAKYSILKFTGDGSTVVWQVEFVGGYISKSHVKAYTTDLNGAIEDRTLQWSGPSTVVVFPAVAAGSILTIYRDTPKDRPLADFTDGSVVSEANLDTNAEQAVYIAAETFDRATDASDLVSTRALLVPNGEVAPLIPPRDRMKQKLLGFDASGKIVPFDPFNGGGNGDTALITHEGRSLQEWLDMLNAIVNSNQTSIVKNAQDIIAAATNTTDLDAALALLRQDHQALTAVVDALAAFDGPNGGLASMFQQESDARINGDVATAAVISLLGAKNGDGSAFILNLDTTRASPTETLAQRFSVLKAQDDNNYALIQGEQQARAGALDAEASAREALAAALPGQIAAAVLTETNARVDAISAEAGQRVALAVTIGPAIAAAVSTEKTARISSEGAITTRLDNMGSTVGDNSAAITSLQGTVADNFHSLSYRIDSIVAGNDTAGLSARISTVETATTDGRFATASSVTNITSVANQAYAWAGASYTAVTDGRFASSSSVTALSSYVNGTVMATASAAYSTSVDAANKLSSARISFVATAGDGRAQFTLSSDGHDGRWELTGDGRIHGSLTVDDSLTIGKAGYNQFSVAARAQAGEYIPGNYYDRYGFATPEDTILSVPIYMPSAGWIELTGKLQQGFNSDGPWAAKLVLSGTDVPASIIGGGNGQDNVFTQGAIWVDHADWYMAELKSGLWYDATRRERVLFVKGFPKTT